MIIAVRAFPHQVAFFQGMLEGIHDFCGRVFHMRRQADRQLGETISRGEGFGLRRQAAVPFDESAHHEIIRQDGPFQVHYLGDFIRLGFIPLHPFLYITQPQIKTLHPIRGNRIQCCRADATVFYNRLVGMVPAPIVGGNPNFIILTAIADFSAGKRSQQVESIGDPQLFQLFAECQGLGKGRFSFSGKTQDKRSVRLQTGLGAALDGFYHLIPGYPFADSFQDCRVAGFYAETHGRAPGRLHFFQNIQGHRVHPGK